MQSKNEKNTATVRLFVQLIDFKNCPFQICSGSIKGIFSFFQAGLSFFFRYVCLKFSFRVFFPFFFVFFSPLCIGVSCMRIMTQTHKGGTPSE